jgi:hypothetical protein
MLLLLMYWYLIQYIIGSRALHAIILLAVYTLLGSALLLLALAVEYTNRSACMSTYVLQE